MQPYIDFSPSFTVRHVSLRGLCVVGCSPESSAGSPFDADAARQSPAGYAQPHSVLSMQEWGGGVHDEDPPCLHRISCYKNTTVA